MITQTCRHPMKQQTRHGEICWYRKYWHPWGTTIGFHDIGYIEIDGRTYAVNRFFAGKSDRTITHYVADQYTDGMGHSISYKTLRGVLDWLAKNGRTSTPCT